MVETYIRLIDRQTAKKLGHTSFDQIEGERANYERRQIQARKPNGELVSALTYAVRHPKPGLKTNLACVGQIVIGFRERGIDEAYIASASNPDIAAEIGAP